MQGLREIGHGLDLGHVPNDRQILEWTHLVDKVVNFCPQRVGLDHHVGVELLPVRSVDHGLGGHEDQAFVAGNDRDADPAWDEAACGDEFFQQEHVALVLLDGRRDAEGAGVAFEGEFSAVVDGHFVGEIL